MSQAGRLGQTVTAAALHYPVDSRLQVNLMTYGNINGLCPQFGAQGGADSLITIRQLGVAARLLSGRLVVTAEPRFSTTDGRGI